MKITICGSMSFAKQMLDAKTKLEEMGHSVQIPDDTDFHISQPGFIDDLEADLAHCIEKDLMRNHMKRVAEADAILVLNYPKNGIDGYIGTSSFMEMGIAYYLKKNIFLFNPPPPMEKVRWAIEVRLTQPTVINGDLSLIN